MFLGLLTPKQVIIWLKSQNSFNSYIPCSGKQKVLVENGSNILVHGKESVAINKDITLDFVLHVLEM